MLQDLGDVPCRIVVTINETSWFPSTDSVHPNDEGDKAMIALYRHALGFAVGAADLPAGMTSQDLDDRTHPC